MKSRGTCASTAAEPGEQAPSACPPSLTIAGANRRVRRSGASTFSLRQRRQERRDEKAGLHSFATPPGHSPECRFPGIRIALLRRLARVGVSARAVHQHMDAAVRLQQRCTQPVHLRTAREADGRRSDISMGEAGVGRPAQPCKAHPPPVDCQGRRGTLQRPLRRCPCTDGQSPAGSPRCAPPGTPRRPRGPAALRWRRLHTQAG